jgi:two-component system OmpR family response regulator
MKTAILSSNLKQANFIRKGLAYENMSATVCHAVQPDAEIMHAIMRSDGLYLFHESREEIERLMRMAATVRQGIPVIIMSLRYETYFDAMKESKRIVDYHVRPYPFRQAASEMKFAVFSMKEKLDVYRYVLRELEIDLYSHQVKIGSENVYLRNKEFLLLQYMMVNKGRVLSRHEILENVWDRNADLMTNTVDVHISKLRKKIERQGLKFIRTIPCLGYVLE